MRLPTALPLLAAALLITASSAFVPFGAPSRRQALSTRRSALFFASSDDDSSDNWHEKALAHNKARTDVRNFLTQRSLQSFITLLIETRDPHTVTWMEDFGGWKNLENFHGTGALNMTKYETWDTVLLEMMQQPMATVVVRAKRRGRGHGGWSKDNPYLPERFMEFEIDIDPTSLVSRILTVREQIAKEWEYDLDMLVQANAKIIQSYNYRVMEGRDSDEDDNNDNEETKKTAYDRTVMAMGDFGIFEARAPSPLRKGNFDLLVLLVTQESVHRILRQYQEEDKQVAFEWLREYYVDRIPKYFDGDGGYARADDFLEELLLTPPAVKKDVGANPDLIDTLAIADDIIRMRTDVALDFQEVVANVPHDHTEVRKVLLEKQMEKWGNAPEPTVEEEGIGTEEREPGEFE